ncbi:proline-rich receptor-like protein kinase PERK2 isoform X1 [Rhinopithecus roxellana]|uniref:proline-rich receptor-like protein kinase PERK2 isoform X1 n=1 Tax=Rhinopithecus roxellana TaxID=61622 RepID=UPI0005331D9F|nr:proline-rich receptor-like protein kinase PERK2 isoform X1 [Rhinopithecus roxellana]
MQTVKTQAAIYRSRGARNTLFPNASCKPGYLSVRWVKLSCSSEIHEVEVVVAQTPLLWRLHNRIWEPARVLTAARWPPEDTERIGSQPSGTTRSQEHPRPHMAPSPPCPPLCCRGPGTPSAAQSRPARPRALTAGVSPPRPTTSCPLPRLPPLNDTELPPHPLEDPELLPPPVDFMEPPAPGLRARSPSGRQEASYAPPSQQARSFNVQNQHMNKTNE